MPHAAKARPPRIGRGISVDVKTTSCANSEHHSWAAWSFVVTTTSWCRTVINPGLVLFRLACLTGFLSWFLFLVIFDGPCSIHGIPVVHFIRTDFVGFTSRLFK